MTALVTSPVFAQEEEQEIQIEIEAGGGVEAGIASSDGGVSSAMAAYPDTPREALRQTERIQPSY